MIAKTITTIVTCFVFSSILAQDIDLSKMLDDETKKEDKEKLKKCTLLLNLHG